MARELQDIIDNKELNSIAYAIGPTIISKIWAGTQAQYGEIEEYDDETLYLIEGETSPGGGGEVAVVDDIPETLEPNERVWVKATQSEWIGASDDYFPTLASGTPWPVKGYKEVVASIELEGQNTFVRKIATNDFAGFNVSQHTADSEFRTFELNENITDYFAVVFSDRNSNAETGNYVQFGNSQVSQSGDSVIASLEEAPLETILIVFIKVYPPEP